MVSDSGFEEVHDPHSASSLTSQPDFSIAVLAIDETTGYSGANTKSSG